MHKPSGHCHSRWSAIRFRALVPYGFLCNLASLNNRGAFCNSAHLSSGRMPNPSTRSCHDVPSTLIASDYTN